MIEDYRKDLGIAPRKISDDEIVHRLVYALVNEGAHILEEGIASKASDIDMVYLTGYGFPLHRGGPMCYADSQGLFNVVQAMQALRRQPARRRRLLEARAAAGQARRRRQELHLTEHPRPPPQPIFEGLTMTDAVIVSTARTPLAKSWKGAFNMTHGATLGGHAVKAAVERAGIDPAAVDDVLMGCANPEGATGMNIARQIALRAGLPVTTSGVTINRFCSSGLQTIAMASQRVIAGEGDIYVAGGVESISCVQQEMNTAHAVRPGAGQEQARDLLDHVADCRDRGQALQRLQAAPGRVRCRQPAEGVRRPGSRQVQGRDRADHGHRRRGRRGAGPAQQGSHRRQADEGLRPGTTSDGIKDIRPAMPGGVITAGNASQFSDGAGACVIVSDSYAQKKNLKPIGRFLGFAVAGCEPDEMGIGPVFAVPKVLARLGLKVSDIDLWELNEAFAVQVLYSADKLGIPMDRLNVNGGAIAIGHPYGVSGQRLTGHALIEGKRRGAKKRLRHDVHRRRHGRGRRVRGALTHTGPA